MRIGDSTMRMVDFSHQLRTGGAVYPGDPRIRLAPAATVERDGFAVTGVEMGSHSGTHVDAPSHTVAKGRTMGDVAIERLVGRAHLIRVPGLSAREPIGMDRLGEPLAALPEDARIVLIATGWDRFWESEEYFVHPYLDGPVAEALRDRGVDVLGMDTLSPDATGVGAADALERGLPVHDALLGADRLIIENLRGLMELPASVESFEFSALPLSMAAPDGAPVRAVGAVPKRAFEGA